MDLTMQNSGLEGNWFVISMSWPLYHREKGRGTYCTGGCTILNHNVGCTSGNKWTKRPDHVLKHSKEQLWNTCGLQCEVHSFICNI